MIKESCMENLIDVLSNEDEWIIPDISKDYKTYSNLCAKREDERNLITTILQPKENYFTRSEVLLTLKHFRLSEYLYPNQKYKNRINFLELIINNGILNSDFITTDKSKLQCVKDKLAIFKEGYYFSDIDNFLIEKSAIDFFRQRFPILKFEVDSGYIKLDQKSEKKFFHFIKKEVNYLNYMGLLFLLDNINKEIYFDAPSKRFIFDYNQPTYCKKENEVYGYIPYNYLLNLFLPYIKDIPLSFPKEDTFIKKRHDRFTNLVLILRNYFNLTNFFPSGTGWEDEFMDIKSIWDSLLKNIHFDQVVKIPQLPTNTLYTLIKGIFLDTDIIYSQDKFRISNLDLIHHIYDFIWEKIIANQPDYFYLTEKHTNLTSISVSDINKNYIHPRLDIPKKDLLKNPLLKHSVSSNSITLNSKIETFTNIGWYEKVRELSGLKDTHLGILVERFLSKKLKEKGINFKNSFSYNCDIPPFTETQYIPKMGECDFVIETETNIIFIELKIKRLTIDSLSGKSQQIILDYAKSYLLALNQALNHECILRKNTLIKNELDSISILNNTNSPKQIDKISLSLFEFDSLHNKRYSSNILKTIINAEFTGNAPKFDEEMNNILNKIRFKVKYLIDEHQINFNELFLSFNRLSIPQLLFILDNSTDTESFVKEINLLRHIDFSNTKDWYRGYTYYKKLSKL